MFAALFVLLWVLISSQWDKHKHRLLSSIAHCQPCHRLEVLIQHKAQDQ